MHPACLSTNSKEIRKATTRKWTPLLGARQSGAWLILASVTIQTLQSLHGILDITHIRCVAPLTRTLQKRAARWQRQLATRILLANGTPPASRARSMR